MIDFYDTLDNEETKSRVEVDLSLIDEAPDAERPWLLWIFFKISDPFSTEFIRFRDDLASTLFEQLEALYAGCIIKDGWCEFYFYASTSKKFENITSDVMARHGSYPYERGSSKDAKWEMYLERLYPEPIDMIKMQNRDTIAALLEAGDDLNRAREVEHYCFFQTPTALKRFSESIISEGFDVKEEMNNDESEYAYGVTLIKDESITPEQVEETTSTLYEATLIEHGIYEGWSTVLAEDEHGAE
ncbi:MAG: DUF695 domain-containing protein [Sulfuricurvum sp.]|uniref:DUF695 domain-containing protein n=1 Tax=Sulfuricurvum sp. TaxID=2025608 RepID=UPI0026398CD8|nr:DUF695 domain-containing protein [Sulfuricurvum sp.]MDD2829030.1 DUF695 domain-containing protein [Sulfuricurvum sp.]MDD4949677.1 DUF695 domain-containing protein [Sulfuricurvum sp.]